MAKNELTQQQGTIPAFLKTQDVDQEILQEITKIIRPPRLKIIQSMAEPPYDKHAQGDVIIIPTGEKIADESQDFHFVVLDFFRAWGTMNPIQLKGKEPQWLAISWDPNSDIARKASSASTWTERHPNPMYKEFEVRHCEQLNFMVCVESKPAMPVLIQFFKGEYSTGSNLASIIGARMAEGCPTYASRFRAVSSLHKGKLGQWYGLDILTPVQPYITEQDMPRYKELSEKLKSMRQASQLDIITEEAVGEAAPDPQFG